MQTKHIRYAFLILGMLCGSIICTPVALQAGHTEWKGYLDQSDISAGAVFIASDPTFVDEQNNPADFAVTRRNMVRLFYGREDLTDVEGNTWSYEVRYRISYPGAGSLPAETDTLVISAGSSNIYEALNLHQSAHHSIKVEILSVATTGTVPGDIRIEGIVETEKYRYLDPSLQPTLAAFDTATQILAWSYVPGVEEYEVEWAWLDDYANTPASATFDNAIRISTTRQHYRPDLSFRKGTVWMRVRAVGRFIKGTGGDYSCRSYAAWSDSVSYVIHPSRSFESDKNWQYVTSYAEEGKFKKVMTYADGTLRSRQVLTNLSTDSLTLVGETKYDREGRPALTISPAPLAGFDLSYRARFNRLNGGGEYEKDDWDGFTSGVALMDSTSGAAKYYSTQNDLNGIYRDYIPHAGNYPFAKAEFMRDGTGRVSRQGGIGADYQLGGGRETKYLYGNTNSSELHRMFGGNAGRSSHYWKQAAIDPNGQISITYTDMAGRTVATALAGDAPENLLEVPDIDTSKIPVSLDSNNVFRNDSTMYVSVNTILNLVEGTQYDFSYQMTGLMDSAGTPFNACHSCVYDLRIMILDPLGNYVEIYDASLPGDVDTLERTFEGSGNCLTGSFSGGTLTFSVTLDTIGAFTVIKELELNPDSLEAQISSLSLLTGYPNLDSITTQFTSQIDSSVCDFSCTDYAYTYLVNFAKKANPSQAQIDSMANVLCGNGIDNSFYGGSDTVVAQRECRSLFWQMASQIGPQGWLYDSARWAWAGGDSTLIDQLLKDTLQHREYCHYTACLVNLDSDIYDKRMSVIPRTWTQADSTGFLNPMRQGGNLFRSDTLNHSHQNRDPYFTQSGLYGITDSSAFKDSLLNFANVNSTWYSLWNYADEQNFNVYPPGDSGTSAMDTLRWYNARGLYLGKKKDFFARYMADTLGCPFYQDVHAIVKDPRSPVSNVAMANGLNGANMADHCNSTCTANVYHWLQVLSDSCGISLTDTTLRDALFDYCLDNCGSENPQGLILYDDFMAGELHTVVSIVNDSACILANIVADSAYYTYQLDSTGTDTVKEPCTQYSACFFLAVDLLNNTYSGSGSIGPAAIYGAMEDYCFNGYDSLEFKNSGEVHLDGTGSCELFRVYDASANKANLDNIKYLQNIRYLAGSPITPSGTNLKFHRMELELVYAGQNADSVVAGYVYTDSTADCGFDLRPTQDSCFVMNGTSFPDSSLFYTIDYDSLRDSCLAELVQMAQWQAQQAWEDSVEAFINAFLHQQNCWESPFEDKFRYEYRPKEYYFTLYYYDQAGNLVQTVPPEGTGLLDSTIIAAWNSGSGADPIHRMKTGYKYNSLEQPVWQSTPDGGVSQLWYDSKGQLRLSQSAEQNDSTDFAYTMYDVLGRVTESGELKDYSGGTGYDSLDVATFPSGLSYTKWDVARTFYDEIGNNGAPFQQNLRNRVSTVTFGRTYALDHSQTWYSYDAHGNVKEMRQYIAGLGTKTMEYEFGLISGNVNRLWYQKGDIDQIIHEYRYDADNRLVQASTSRDGLIWDRDGKYFYYDHGPLARLELGEDLVQTADHFYTIHGWIKGCNMPGKDENKDPGRDGDEDLSNSLNKWVSRDKYAFQLGFYEGEFQSIGGADLGLGSNAWTDFSSHILKKTGMPRGLFNGNIAFMLTDLDESAGGFIDEAIGYAYQYDQLNRIKYGNSYYRDGTWKRPAAGGIYDTYYAYDKNGNIDSLWRRMPDQQVNPWSSTRFDAMLYHYATDVGGNRINNKLEYVDDGDAPSAYSLDIDDQNPANYSYDASGNLVSDVSESIDLIRWTASGKVQGVERTSAGRTSGQADLEFYYDALGNRIKKQVNTLIGGQGVITTTFYVTDPQGNVIAIYEELEESGDDVTYLREQPIYGSDRIGMWRPNVEVYRSGSGTGWGNRVIVTEVNYDSPATHPDSVGGNEERVGEYLVLWNPRNDTVQLDDVKLKNWENDTEIELGASDSLLPYQKMLLHYGSSSDDSLFRLRTLIPDSVLEDVSLQRRWHTALKLNDPYGTVGVIYTAGDGTETRVDTFSYGASLGLVAENAYVVPEDMDSLDIREANWSLRRQTYNSNLNGILWNPPSNSLAKQGGQVGGTPMPAPFAGNDFQLAKSGKNYELKNHLGNVLMVVSDLKLGQETGSPDDTVEYYVPEVLAANDYYPFGMLMPKRRYSAETYRYGFNGKENDSEWKGEGNSQDYGFRINDPRLGRFLSVDPLAPEYPWYTPYQFAGNEVIGAIDLDGLEPKTMIHANGRLTKPMIAILRGAFGYSEKSLAISQWLPYNNGNLSDRAWAEMTGTTPSGNTSATVKGWKVLHDDDKTRSDPDWFGLIAHEQSHREDIDRQGTINFYIDYFSEGIHGYRQISTEEKAYRRGADGTSSADYSDLLLLYKSGAVLTILNSSMKGTVKEKRLLEIGSKFRRDFVIPGEVAYLKGEIKNFKSAIAAGSLPGMIEDLAQEAINMMQNQISIKKAEQKLITKKYGP